MTAFGAMAGSIEAFWATAKSPTGPTPASPGARLMNLVAHQDDDLLFLSPALLNAIRANASVRTVFLTAGDAGEGIAYWSAREQGVQAAYARMAGVRDVWSHSTVNAAGRSAEVFTLSALPSISLVFLRLPDGALDGSGNIAYHYQSLQKLYTGSIPEISAVDGSATYTRSSLISSLAAHMASYRPTAIHTQDYVGHFGDGDHSDHHATAYFAQLANQQYLAPHRFVGFEDYGTAQRPANVAAADRSAKIRAFEAYANYDNHVCRPWSACAGTTFSPWVARQYVVGVIPARSAS